MSGHPCSLTQGRARPAAVRPLIANGAHRPFEPMKHARSIPIPSPSHPHPIPSHPHPIPIPSHPHPIPTVSPPHPRRQSRRPGLSRPTCPRMPTQPAGHPDALPRSRRRPEQGLGTLHCLQDDTFRRKLGLREETIGYGATKGKRESWESSSIKFGNPTGH
jgi:hypothetical protein